MIVRQAVRNLLASKLRLILTFIGVSSLALLLQYILFMSALTETAVGLPNDGLVLMEQVNGLLLGVFLTSFGMLLPTLFAIGLVMTHRVAGPIYRFEVFFNRILGGERPADIKLRKGDELQELCALLNRAAAPARQEGGAADEAPPRRRRVGHGSKPSNVGASDHFSARWRSSVVRTVQQNSGNPCTSRT